jgi:ABC-2 type transport system permease protein
VSDVALMVQQAAFGIRGGFRNVRAVVFTIVFPIVLLVMFNSVFSGKNGTTKFEGARIDFASYFTPGIVAYSIMLTGFSGLLIALTTDRERGLLKRYRGTPMPPWVFLGGQILQSVAMVLIMAVGLIAIGAIAYDVHVRSEAFGALALYLVLGTATMCSLGIALTRVTTTADAASAVGPFLTVILGFVSGVFISTDNLPAWLEDLGRVFPLAHLAEGLQRCFSPASTGSALDGANVAVLAAWGVVGLAVAIRTFRWDPQGAGT